MVQDKQNDMCLFLRNLFSPVDQLMISSNTHVNFYLLFRLKKVLSVGSVFSVHVFISSSVCLSITFQQLVAHR